MVNVLLKSLQRTPKGYKNLHRVVETEKLTYFFYKKNIIKRGEFGSRTARKDKMIQVQFNRYFAKKRPQKPRKAKKYHKRT